MAVLRGPRKGRGAVRFDINRMLLALVLFTVAFSVALAVRARLDAVRETTIIIGAGDADGESFAIMQAVEALARRYEPTLNIIVAETGGSQANVDLLDRGLIDAAAIQANVSVAPSVRLITQLYPDTYQLIAREGAGVASVPDLAGKTVALSGTSEAQRAAFLELVGHYGLDESDMRLIRMSEAGAAWELDNGGVDAKFTIRAPGNSTLREQLRGRSVVFVPIDQADALRLNQSTIEPGIIPRGSYQGSPPIPPDDLATAVVPRLLVSTRDVDDAVVERLTRLIYDHRRELTEVAPLLGFMADGGDLASSRIPLHEGARAFYTRDDPSFLQENAEVLAFYLTIVAGLVSLLLRLNGRRQKSRSDAYTRRLVGIYNDAVDDPAPEPLHYRNRMMSVFADIVRDTESGMLSSNGFDFLSFAWDEMNDAVAELVDTKTRGLAKDGPPSALRLSDTAERS